MKNILIVENSTVIINVLRELFESSSNFSLDIVTTYKEAELLLKEKSFFMAISNLVLNDALNGEILNLFKQTKLPNIVLTSKVDEATLKLIHSYPIVDYVLKTSFHEISKAYSLAELLYAIEGKSVLIVEDSISSAKLLEDALSSLLLNVKVAQNGLEALDLLENDTSISLVITDYNMEEMNGLELIKRIRKEESYSHIPIISMSTQINDNNLKIQLYKHGANSFIHKPILIEELKTKVIHILSARKQLDDIQSYNVIFDENVISSTTDVNGIITHVSQAFCDIAGYTKEEMIGQPHCLVRHPDMSASIFEDLWQTIQEGQTWKGEIKNLHKDGGFYWVSAVIKPNFNAKGEIRSYTSIRQDITDKKHIYELSITDGLTHLYNRRYFNDEVPTLMQDIDDRSYFGFVLLDVDNFKKYNDTYGHQAGDEVLIAVSKSLQTSFTQENEKVFRLGGEEFGIILHGDSIEQIISKANEAREHIESLQIKHEKNPFNVVTASFGISIVSKEIPLSIDDMYNQADESLYHAKENGRNQVSYLQGV